MAYLDDDDVLDIIAGAQLSSTGWYRAACPVCEDNDNKRDTKLSFGLYAASGGYHCFKCGTKGYLKEPLAGFANVIEKPKENADELPVIPAPQSFIPLWTEDSARSLVLAPARQYAKSRGLTRELCRQVEIGAAIGGYFDQRLIVPLKTPDGVWRGFIARDWTGYAERSYLYPKGMSRSKVMFNLGAIMTPSTEPVLVVEGCLDALPYWPNAVACLGKPVAKHFAYLLQAARPIAVCLDGDSWREGKALAMRLRFEGKQAGFVRLPPASDPNSIDHEWLRQQAAECVGEKQDGIPN